LTSTLAITIEARIWYLVLLAMHELVIGVVTLVCTKEIEVSSPAAVAAQLPCGAVDFFMPRIVA